MRKEYSKKWQLRFDFYHRMLGIQGTPAYDEACRRMSFGQRLTVNFNFYGFFFSVIYLFILGLWRKGLVILAIMFLPILLANSLLPTTAENAALIEVYARTAGLLGGVVCGKIANCAYYLKECKGVCGWIPFEGLNNISAKAMAALPDIRPAPGNRFVK